jgi:phage/plasmid-associated DNA primase
MAECEIFVRPADLDKDPFALNFLNATVELRTGEPREPSGQTSSQSWCATATYD